MSPHAVKLAGRPADRPFKKSQGKCTEMSIFRWLELSRQEITRIKKQEKPGV
ncbi:hypothetical protein DCCM_1035 [Desulfocucumis palustris]|uniref:Uncharacterized protein n=1 Tax=Desulfocucumis palustris TaxID=1898651 RepID=A0A2L2X9C7_9FIRM|nr:hypothetical protein [Desulfocucumis palustris]GBF32839.1 hypothetical protein DCCM_1035 [Desulfocucumis palustris]